VNHPIPSGENGLNRRTLLIRVGATLSALPLVALAASCASSQRDAKLPDPVWPKDAGPAYKPTPIPPKTEVVTKSSPVGTTNVIPRSQWAKAAPIPSRMDPMLPVNKITLHHDGMPSSFTSTSQSAAAEHLESIRKAHIERGFGDVGYHFLIDPAGRVWAGRDLRWQGAHVKDQNPGNLGICIMGNYEIQRPNSTQLQATQVFVVQAMRYYNVPVSRVYTHRELAPTACPGRYMQPELVSMRRSSSLA